MALTHKQQEVLGDFLLWYRSILTNNPVDPYRRIFTLGGYAGTGKTYLIGKITEYLRKQRHLNIAFITFTGKASFVLANKVKPFMIDGDYCGTIHGLMYSLVGKDQRTRELFFEKRIDALPYDLIILDEASMVNRQVLEDLLAYNLPILAVGDHGQLPPVKGSFNLMENPDHTLEEIVRQEEGNPIIRIAQMARETGRIDFGDYGQGCIKTRKVQVLHDHIYDDTNSVMLCALNQTRTRMNTFAREQLFENVPDYPLSGEPVICLKNNRKKQIFNGQIGVLLNMALLDEETAQAEINMTDFLYRGKINLQQFGQKYLDDRAVTDSDFFDYAYCITVWKSQGSEWNNVLLLEEYLPKMDDDTRRKLLYTACTRAKERLVIFKR